MLGSKLILAMNFLIQTKVFIALDKMMYSRSIVEFATIFRYELFQLTTPFKVKTNLNNDLKSFLSIWKLVSSYYVIKSYCSLMNQKDILCDTSL